MSDEFDREFGDEAPDWLKKLRADARAYEALTKKAQGRKPEELIEGYFTLEAKQRTATLADTLKAKGVNPKVAQFFPADLEPTEDNITSWLKDFADVFGVKVEDHSNEGQQAEQPEGQAQQPPAPTPEWASQFQQIQGQPAGQAPDRQNTTEAALAELDQKTGSVAEFIEAYRQKFGGGGA